MQQEGEEAQLLPAAPPPAVLGPSIGAGGGAQQLGN